jgi:muramoyltetrapeptide carboxypeptidase
LACEGYLAGNDAQRLRDVNWAFREETIDAVWCIRGGYGLTRILDRIDYGALTRRPRPVMGYSDVTALHCAIGRVCAMVTFHAPTARETITPFSRNSFERAICFGEDSCGTAHAARTIRTGTITGRLAGGNLALVAALCGTRYAPDLRDAILVLEDVNEPVYRIDRMFRQLLMSGMLDGLRAIAFGQCTSSDGPGDQISPQERTLDTVLREIADLLKIPCVAGLPIGHVPEQWTIPLGALATLDAGALTMRVHTS